MPVDPAALTALTGLVEGLPLAGLNSAEVTQHVRHGAVQNNKENDHA